MISAGGAALLQASNTENPRENHVHIPHQDTHERRRANAAGLTLSNGLYLRVDGYR